MIKSADIILVKHNSLVGWLIRKITNAPFNHVGIMLSEHKTIEAAFSGIVIRDLKKDYINKQQKGKLYFEIYRVKNIKDSQRLKVIKFALKQLGRKYDFIQLLSLFFFFLFHINRKNVEPIEYGNKFICSEFVAECFEKANIILTDVDIDNTTPADIWRSKRIYKLDFEN